MTPHDPRPLVVRCVLASALAGVAWTFTARPARAEYAEARRRLDAQTAQASAFASPGVSESDTAGALQALRDAVENIERDLTRPSGATPVFNQIERFAQRHAVEVVRTDPGGTAQIPSLSDTDAEDAHGEPRLFADTFSLELVGGYGDIAGFIEAVQNEMGMTHISMLRLSPGPPGQARAQVEFAAYRLHPGDRLLPAPQEAQADD